MDVSLFQAAAAMNASTRWQDAISKNLTAGQIPGFKKQDLSFSAVQAGLMPGATGTTPVSMQRFVMPLAGTSTNFNPGELQPTSVNTDFGIEGPGFFEVQLPDGSSGYTRNGQFRLNAQGQLTTSNGMLVMSSTGPVQLDLNNPGQLTVAADGQISQGGTIKGKLKLAEFSNPAQLTAAGSGLYIITNPSVQPLDPTHSSVRQGYLESANVSPMMEMGELITAMRFYEANQKVVQAADDRLGKLISEVASPA